jgi:hypothetical protein
VYIRVLRAMTPEQRLRKAFELGATARAMFEHGQEPEVDLVSIACVVQVEHAALDDGVSHRRLRAEARPIA